MSSHFHSAQSQFIIHTLPQPHFQDNSQPQSQIQSQPEFQIKAQIQGQEQTQH